VSEPGAVPLRLLLVEDSEVDAALLLRELRRGGFEPQHTRVDSAAAMREAFDDMRRQIEDVVRRRREPLKPGGGNEGSA